MLSDSGTLTGRPITFEFSEIAKSDVAFIERLAKIEVKPVFLQDLRVLHLNLERNWMGTNDYL